MHGQQQPWHNQGQQPFAYNQLQSMSTPPGFNQPNQFQQFSNQPREENPYRSMNDSSIQNYMQMNLQFQSQQQNQFHNQQIRQVLPQIQPQLPQQTFGQALILQPPYQFQSSPQIYQQDQMNMPMMTYQNQMYHPQQQQSFSQFHQYIDTPSQQQTHNAFQPSFVPKNPNQAWQPIKYIQEVRKPFPVKLNFQVQPFIEKELIPMSPFLQSLADSLQVQINIGTSREQNPLLINDIELQGFADKKQMNYIFSGHIAPLISLGQNDLKIVIQWKGSFETEQYTVPRIVGGTYVFKEINEAENITLSLTCNQPIDLGNGKQVELPSKVYLNLDYVADSNFAHADDDITNDFAKLRASSLSSFEENKREEELLKIVDSDDDDENDGNSKKDLKYARPYNNAKRSVVPVEMALSNINMSIVISQQKYEEFKQIYSQMHGTAIQENTQKVTKVQGKSSLHSKLQQKETQPTSIFTLGYQFGSQTAKADFKTGEDFSIQASRLAPIGLPEVSSLNVESSDFLPPRKQNTLVDVKSLNQDNYLLAPDAAKPKKKKHRKRSKKSSSNSGSGSSHSSKGSRGASPTFRIDEGEIVPQPPPHLADLKGQVVSQAISQQGSKHLQKLLSKASPEFVDFALAESLTTFHTLMVDQYGNYFCQKLLQSSSSQQRLKILSHLKPHFLKISCDRKGTHSMQCLIEMINMPEEEKILQASIEPKIIELAVNMNGTHVLQKTLLCMKEENTQYIVKPVLTNFYQLACDQHGLCVIKKIISKASNKETIGKILEILERDTIPLVQNAYGNYAIQQAFDIWDMEVCNTLYERLMAHLLQLSVQKFSSNVLEKLLDKNQEEVKQRFLKTLCKPDEMKGLIKNQYGCYVITKLHNVLDKQEDKNEILLAVEGALQYVTDKQLKQRWMALLGGNQNIHQRIVGKQKP